MIEGDQVALQQTIFSLNGIPDGNYPVQLREVPDMALIGVARSLESRLSLSQAAWDEVHRRLVDPEREIPLEVILLWGEGLGGSSLEGEDERLLGEIVGAIARCVPHENPEGVARGLARYVWRQLDEGTTLLDEALSYSSDIGRVAELTIGFALQRRSYISRKALQKTMDGKIFTAERLRAERSTQS